MKTWTIRKFPDENSDKLLSLAYRDAENPHDAFIASGGIKTEYLGETTCLGFDKDYNYVIVD